LDEWLKSAPC